MVGKPADTFKKDFFPNALFDVEHALLMYASDYCMVFAEDIYDKDVLAPLMSVIEKSHIYAIGYTPAVRFRGARQHGAELEIDMSVARSEHTVRIEIPQELTLTQDDGNYVLKDSSGRQFWPNERIIRPKLEAITDELKFNVKYIGQAYGKDGSRNAIDRLLKHETLQKIAIKGVPDGYRLTILMLAIQPSNRMYTVMNPFAKNKDDDGSRIRNGLDKLFNTTDKERVSLYEAALIRYFYPEFNKEFKDSFPSTNLRILQDCYDKDFGGVLAEVSLERLGFRLCSERIGPKHEHVAHHHFHTAEERKVFFGL